MSFDRLVSLAEQSIWLITSALAYGSGGSGLGVDKLRAGARSETDCPRRNANTGM